MSEEKSALGDTDRRQLRRLARRFPKEFWKRKGKFPYIEHAMITQVLLNELGPFDFTLSQVIRSADGVVTGAVCRLTCTVDGRVTTIEEAGDVENPQSKGTDGARLKDAFSDALKRCAMRLGLGLHMWADHYLLDRLLKHEEDVDPSEEADASD